MNAGPAQLAFVAANALALGLFAATVLLPDGGQQAAVAAPAPASGASTPVLFIASRGSGTDALVGRAAARALDGQVRLVSRSSVTGDVRAEVAGLAPARVIVLGGPTAVSDSVIGELKSVTEGPVSRVAGPHRYATAAMVAINSLPVPVDRVFVANGNRLAGASSVPTTREGRGPVLLVDGGRLPEETAAALRRLRPREIVVLGGVDDVPASLVAALDAFTAGPVSRSG